MNLNQVSIVLTFIVTFTFDFINSQQYVSLTTDSLVNFREEKLPFTCTPQSLATSGAISSITLQKKQSNGLYNDVVNVFLDIAGTITNQTIWTDTTMQSLASVNKSYVNPSSSAGLQFEIAADRVRCDLSGEYRCAITSSTGGSLASESPSRNVSISVTPTQTEDPDDPDTPFNAAITGGVIGASVAIVLTIVIAFIVYSKAFKTKHAVNPCIETSNDTEVNNVSEIPDFLNTSATTSVDNSTPPAATRA